MIFATIQYVNKKFNELFQSVSNGKSLIASAITDKGVSTSQDATFSKMAENIRTIQTGSTGITPTGTKNITTNGTHDVTAYASANVNVPIPSGYVKPSGTLPITANGEHTVTNYEKVSVNIPVPEVPEQNSLVVDFDATGASKSWLTICQNDLLAEHRDTLQMNWMFIGTDTSTSGQNPIGGVACSQPLYTTSGGTKGYQICHFWNSARTGITNLAKTTSLANDKTATDQFLFKVTTAGELKFFHQSAYPLLAGVYRFVFTW